VAVDGADAMEDVAAMLRIAVLASAAVLSCAAFETAAAADSAPAGRPALAGPGQELTDISAQSSRPRARIRVTPRRRGLDNSPYPRPYAIEYPGPGAKRDCVARYVQEYRPSGTVIVPRMNCRWIRG
jgi:hypothetical protein